MRSRIAERFPDHGINGEEFPAKPGAGRYCWSLDPVDGTRSFICGLPTWTTLIALLDDGEPVLGLIDAPMLDDTYVGSGAEAWLARGDEQHSDPNQRMHATCPKRACRRRTRSCLTRIDSAVRPRAA